MLSIRLNPDTEGLLAALARRTGRAKTYVARELIEGNIERLEDRRLAEAGLASRRKPVFVVAVGHRRRFYAN